MSLWQNLVAGYDEKPELWKSFPLSATTIAWKSNSFAVILLASDGSFRKSWTLPKSPVQVIMAPGTQGSLGRTSTAIRPHALFDSRAYVFPPKSSNGGVKVTHKRAQSKTSKYQATARKFDEYRKQLKDFAESSFATEKIQAVNKYINSNPDFDKDLPKGTDDKTFILFAVEIKGDPITNLWEDPAIFKAWSDYYSSQISQDANKLSLDFITGTQQQPSQSHPRNIIPFAYGAKLVSANDSANFSFRGIFRHPNDFPDNKLDAFKQQFGLSDAVTIGYESSQKAHQYLRYLISTHGISCGEQVIVPFSIGAPGKRMPTPPVQDADDDWDEDETETTADSVLALKSRTGKDYAESIRKALQGYELDGQWKTHARSAIVILEAATPGRLSVTFYREFASSEYMEHIAQWHEDCKWPLWRKKGNNPVLYFGAPSIDTIIQASFGWPKLGQDKAFEKIRMRARQNLIRSIFDNAPIPADYLANAVRRVSNPLGISDGNGKFDRKRFSSVLATTCAIFKQHETTNHKESFDMSIDLRRTDRDYLYGRLLGAADKLEQYALKKKNNDRYVTAAIRHMQTFSQRPFSSWQIIHQSLVPYKQQVRGSIEDRELQSISNQFNGDGVDFCNDSPLSGLYLIGYYHECAYIDELKRAAHEKSSQNTPTQEN